MKVRITVPDQFLWCAERRMLNHWVWWRMNGDKKIVLATCGLTGAGSPRTIMDRVWEWGAQSEGDVIGYARDLPVYDYLTPEVDLFLHDLGSVMPRVHAALLARHLRLIDGRVVKIRSERRLAIAYYGQSARYSHERLIRDCDIGYGMLRIRMQNKLEMFELSVA